MSHRFAFVINSLAPGGAERSLIEALPHLGHHGIEPMLVILSRQGTGWEEEVEAGGFDVHYLSGRTILSKAWDLGRILRSSKPDLVHTVLFEADVVGRVAAIGTGIPVLTTLANVTYSRKRLDADPHLNRVAVELIRFVDAITAKYLTTHFHAVSHTVKASAMKALGLRDEDVTVVYRGRDPERLGVRSEGRTKAVRDMLELDDEADFILTIGRQEFQKGQIHLIRALALITESRPNSVLVIAGRSGAESQRLRSEVEQLGLEDAVMFVGHRDDVADLLAAADVFVFPSLWEGLGGALIEALALEVPIVASDLEALREVLGDEGRGILVSPGDERSIAAATIALLRDPEYALELAVGNRHRYEQSFSSSVAAEHLSDLMMSVAGVDRPKLSG